MLAITPSHEWRPLAELSRSALRDGLAPAQAAYFWVRAGRSEWLFQLQNCPIGPLAAVNMAVQSGRIRHPSDWRPCPMPPRPADVVVSVTPPKP